MRIKATEHDKNWIVATVQFCKKHGLQLNNLYYSAKYLHDGVYLTIFITKSTTSKEIKDAITLAKWSKNVVNYDLIVCPKEWLQ